MGDKWPRVITDPVHGIVQFEGKAEDKLLFDLIDQSEFQRLRHIRQLGFSELVYPSANHTRFSHSLGVMHIARKMLARLESVRGVPYTPEARLVVLVGALLHDVGHGPFSHAFEKATGENHVGRTIQTITDPSTGINQVLRAHAPELPDAVARLLQGVPLQPDSKFAYPPHVCQLVSSQLDADRLDYLQRDSNATGTPYGIVDADWILSHIHEYQEHLFLEYKALCAAEQYVFARLHMYRVVYYHKTTRGVEVMLASIFKRYRALRHSGSQPDHVAPGAPTIVLQALDPKGASSVARIPLKDYLALDEHALWSFLRACQTSKDRIVAELASGIVNRKLLKCLEFDPKRYESSLEFDKRARVALAEYGYDPDYFLQTDEPGITAYQPYKPDAEKPETIIFIGDPDNPGSLRALEDLGVSEAVATLVKEFSLHRYYYPGGDQTLRQRVLDLARELLYN